MGSVQYVPMQKFGSFSLNLLKANTKGIGVNTSINEYIYIYLSILDAVVNFQSLLHMYVLSGALFQA